MAVGDVAAPSPLVLVLALAPTPNPNPNPDVGVEVCRLGCINSNFIPSALIVSSSKSLCETGEARVSVEDFRRVLLFTLVFIVLPLIEVVAGLMEDAKEELEDLKEKEEDLADIGGAGRLLV